MTRFHLENLIEAPTRITNSTATMIDVLLTNNSNIMNYTA